MKGRLEMAIALMILIVAKIGKTLLMGVSLALDGGKHVAITKK